MNAQVFVSQSQADYYQALYGYRIANSDLNGPRAARWSSFESNDNSSNRFSIVIRMRMSLFESFVPDSIDRERHLGGSAAHGSERKSRSEIRETRNKPYLKWTSIAAVAFLALGPPIGGST